MRRRYIDWARGVAILVMVEAHTFDAWTKVPVRSSHAFRNLTILGGFAAPLFLWLAGLALVLSAERRMARGAGVRSATSAVCQRGLEIFVLAFLFRIQALIVSPGNPLVMVFRVDILNIMGPAMVVTGLVWGLMRSTKTSTQILAFGALATATAMVTPIVRAAAWVDALPLWFTWYVRPSADYTAFTLFPWVAFVFAGAAVGVVVTAVQGVRAEGRLQAALAASGAFLVALGFAAAARPTIYAHSTFWNTSPAFFAIRVGVLMLALAAFYAGEKLLARMGTGLPALEKFGRSSLFVYWIHVELVYGYATWPLRRHLSLWEMAIAYSAFTAALYGAVLLRDRTVAGWRARRPAGAPATPAMA